MVWLLLFYGVAFFLEISDFLDKKYYMKILHYTVIFPLNPQKSNF